MSGSKSAAAGPHAREHCWLGASFAMNFELRMKDARTDPEVGVFAVGDTNSERRGRRQHHDIHAGAVARRCGADVLPSTGVGLGRFMEPSSGDGRAASARATNMQKRKRHADRKMQVRRSAGGPLSRLIPRKYHCVAPSQRAVCGDGINIVAGAEDNARWSRIGRLHGRGT